MSQPQDPHGLLARMNALGLTHKDVGKALGLAPNTVTRAVSTTKASDSRPRIAAWLTKKERGTDTSIPTQLPHAARRLAQLAGDDRLYEARIEYVGDGKVQRLVAVLVDSDLTHEEIEREVREWRKGHGDRE